MKWVPTYRTEILKALWTQSAPHYFRDKLVQRQICCTRPSHYIYRCTELPSLTLCSPVEYSISWNMKLSATWLYKSKCPPVLWPMAYSY